MILCTTAIPALTLVCAFVYMQTNVSAHKRSLQGEEQPLARRGPFSRLVFVQWYLDPALTAWLLQLSFRCLAAADWMAWGNNRRAWQVDHCTHRASHGALTGHQDLASVCRGALLYS